MDYTGTIYKWIISNNPPTSTNVMWYDTSTKELKVFNNGTWEVADEGLKVRLGIAEENIVALQNRMTEAEGDISALELEMPTKASKEELEAAIDKSLGEIQEAMENLPDGQAVSAQVALNTTAIESLQGDVSQLGQQVISNAINIADVVFIEQDAIDDTTGQGYHDNTRARSRTFLKAPFVISTKEGYTVASIFKYIIDAYGNITYDSYKILNLESYSETDARYIYKLTFRKTDDAWITADDISDIVDSFKCSLTNLDEDINTLNEHTIQTTFTHGKYINVAGVYSDSSASVEASDFIPCLGYSKIRTNVCLNTNGLYVAFYDYKQSFISNYTIAGVRNDYIHNIEIPNGAVYVRLSNTYSAQANPEVILIGIENNAEKMMYSEQYSEYGDVTYNSNGAIETCSVIWSDGTIGTLTYTDWSASDYMYKGYEITCGTKKLIQPAVILTNHKITSIPKKYIVTI